jgi:small-conductance mechanosensitive channel
LTGVIVGIAAQASLSNIIAGVVILFARPYSAGMYVTVRTTAFGGVEYSGQVREVGLFYTSLHTHGKEIRIPNSTMVAAVVVLRPQQLDVYIPITLPRSADLPACLEQLQGAIESSTVAQSAAQVALESVTRAGYVVGVRVFAASEAERRAVERAITAIAHRKQNGQADRKQNGQADLTAATPLAPYVMGVLGRLMHRCVPPTPSGSCRK